MKRILLVILVAAACGGCATAPPKNASGLEFPPVEYAPAKQ